MATNGLHIALCALLGTAWAFAVIELGLSAYIVSLFDSVGRLGSGLGGFGGLFGYSISKPPITSFAVFASVWTILVSTGCLVAAWFFARKASVSRSLNMILAVALIAIYVVTMGFWLGTFADFSVEVGGSENGFFMSSYWKAIIAFGVLLWLIFMALLILTILAVTGVLHSDWPGYSSFREHSRAQPEAQPEIEPDVEFKDHQDVSKAVEVPTHSGAGHSQPETQPEPEPQCRQDAPRFVEAPAYSEVAELPDSSQMKRSEEETPVSHP